MDVNVFATSDEADQSFPRSGRVRRVSASGDASRRLLRREGRSGQRRPDSRLRGIFPALKDKPWNTVGDMNTASPRPGCQPLDVHQGRSNQAPTSWGDHVEKTLPVRQGSPYDNPIYIADAAVYLKATQPEFDIENPYALDQKQFDAATRCRAADALVGEYWTDLVKPGPEFVTGSENRSQVAGHRQYRKGGHR